MLFNKLLAEAYDYAKFRKVSWKFSMKVLLSIYCEFCVFNNFFLVYYWQNILFQMVKFLDE